MESYSSMADAADTGLLERASLRDASTRSVAATHVRHVWQNE